jgi:hypothetical protein
MRRGHSGAEPSKQITNSKADGGSAENAVVPSSPLVAHWSLLNLACLNQAPPVPGVDAQKPRGQHGRVAEVDVVGV